MKKNLIVGLMILISLFSVSIVSADMMNGYGMGGMMYGVYGPGMMIFGWLFGLLVVVALILFIIWLIKQIQKK